MTHWYLVIPLVTIFLVLIAGYLSRLYNRCKNCGSTKERFNSYTESVQGDFGSNLKKIEITSCKNCGLIKKKKERIVPNW